MVLAFNKPLNFAVSREQVFRVGTWLLLVAIIAFLGWNAIARRYQTTADARCRTHGIEGCLSKPGVATLPVAPR